MQTLVQLDDRRPHDPPILHIHPPRFLEPPLLRHEQALPLGPLPSHNLHAHLVLLLVLLQHLDRQRDQALLAKGRGQERFPAVRALGQLAGAAAVEVGGLAGAGGPVDALPAEQVAAGGHGQVGRGGHADAAFEVLEPVLLRRVGGSSSSSIAGTRVGGGGGGLSGYHGLDLVASGYIFGGLGEVDEAYSFVGLGNTIDRILSSRWWGRMLARLFRGRR